MELSVLIADDDEMLILMIKTLVKTSGLSSSPLTFQNGKELLAFLINKEWDSTNLILLDINMPVMNGWEFLDEFETKNIAHYFSVVIITSSTDEKDKQRASSYKTVKGFIEKPVKLNDFENLKHSNYLR